MLTMVSPITCFLVDDDADDLEIFSIAAAEVQRSIVCVTAVDGVDALQKLRSNERFTPDFIFLDLNMPRMNGKQTLVEIKKIPRLATVPVIIYSTSARPLDVEETLQLGAFHFLTKPSSITKLTKELAALIKYTRD
jgi:CheY-like chemotaxis protein